jgi:hypothetical protein
VSDSYQAIYDAVRSRISGGDIGSAVRDIAFQQFDISHMKATLQQDFSIAAQEMARPSVLWRPSICQDGTKWHALYGPNQMEGVSGFGDTPAEAMADFDNNWWKERTVVAIKIERKIEEEEAAAARHADSQFGVGA